MKFSTKTVLKHTHKLQQAIKSLNTLQTICNTTESLLTPETSSWNGLSKKKKDLLDVTLQKSYVRLNAV